MINAIRVSTCCLILVLLVSLAISCKDSGNINLSEGEAIDRQRMIQLMADMEITESALRIKQSKVNRDSMEVLSNRAYDSLYLYYKITPKIFSKNLKYYQSNMAEYEKMMEEKITLLSKKKDSISLENDKSDTASAVTKKTTL